MLFEQHFFQTICGTIKYKKNISNDTKTKTIEKESKNTM